MLKIQLVYKFFLILMLPLILVYLYQVLVSINENLDEFSSNYNQGIYRIALTLLWLINFVMFFLSLNIIFRTKTRLFKNFLIVFFFLLGLQLLFPDPDMSIGTAMFRTLALTLAPLAFLNFYTIFKRVDLSAFFLKCFFLLFVGLCFIYFIEFSAVKAVLEIDNKSYNSAYIPLMALPLVLCLDKKWIRISAIIAVSLIILSSNKRGGLVAFAFAIFVYYLITQLIKGKKNGILPYIYLMFFLILSWIGFSYYDSQNDGFFLYRLEKLQEDGGSGRLDIYAQVLNGIGNSDIVSFFLGHNDNAVSKITFEGFSAHNDFLEVLYNYGFLFFIVYVALQFNVFLSARNLVKRKYKYAAPMALSCVLFLVFSMISHIFIYQYFLLLVIFWAFVLGTFERENTSQRVKEVY